MVQDSLYGACFNGSHKNGPPLLVLLKNTVQCQFEPIFTTETCLLEWKETNKQDSLTQNWWNFCHKELSMCSTLKINWWWQKTFHKAPCEKETMVLFPRSIWATPLFCSLKCPNQALRSHSTSQTESLKERTLKQVWFFGVEKTLAPGAHFLDNCWFGWWSSQTSCPKADFEPSKNWKVSEIMMMPNSMLLWWLGTAHQLESCSKTFNLCAPWKQNKSDNKQKLKQQRKRTGQKTGDGKHDKFPP